MKQMKVAYLFEDRGFAAMSFNPLSSRGSILTVLH